MKKISILLVFLSFFSTAQAWDFVGHAIVMQIAWDQLSPLERIHLKHWLRVDPGLPPRKVSLYQAPNWMDVIKEVSSKYDTWHYINQPWYSDKTSLMCLKKNKPPHIVWALSRTRRQLQDKNLTLSRRARALRMMLHLVADIHQPLHCINRVNSEYPAGDKGGNDQQIQTESGHYQSLHYLWDSDFYSTGFSFHSHRRYEFIRTLSYRIEKEYPQETLEYKKTDTDFADWAKESYELAQKAVYPPDGINRITPLYRLTAERTVHRQLALAGYRLASLLHPVLAVSPFQLDR